MKKGKLLSLLVVTVMLIGILAGCQSGDTTGGDPTPPPAVGDNGDTQNEQPDTPDTPAGGLMDNGVPMSAPGQLPVALEPVTMTAVIRQPTWLEDVRYNTWTLELQERTNVFFDFTVIEDAHYDERLNLLLASGDYPEVILSGVPGGAGGINQFGVREQILIPLNDIIDEHGHYIFHHWERRPQIRQDMLAADGNIYGIPALDNDGQGHTQAPMKMWINQHWLENLGLDMPTTTDEFHNVLRAFKTQDPNGNGLDDIIPLTGAINTWNGENYIFLLNAFGFFDHWNLFHLYNNVVTSTLDKEYIRDGLAWIAEMYAEGLIDPVALSQGESEMAAIGTHPGHPIVGAFSAGHVGMGIDITDIERSSMYTTLLPLQGPGGYRGIPYTQDVRVSGAMFAITDIAQHPIIAYKWADMFMSEEFIIRSQYGIQGVHWDVADPGTLAFDGVTPAKWKHLEFAAGVADLNNDMWGWVMRLLEMDHRNMFQLDGDIFDPVNYEGRLYAETVRMLPYAATHDAPPPLLLDSDTQIRHDTIHTAVRDHMLMFFAEVITGRQDVHDSWDQWLSDLERLGYPELIQITQNAISG